MKQEFAASVSMDGEWYVAQALDIDVASQGLSVEDALANLREALELHFEPPVPTVVPQGVGQNNVKRVPENKGAAMSGAHPKVQMRDDVARPLRATTRPG